MGSEEPRHPRGRVWIRHRDDEVVWQFCCPGCGLRGDIDEDQLHGRVSIDCPRCEFHETLTETPKVIAGPESIQYVQKMEAQLAATPKPVVEEEESDDTQRA